MIYAIVLVLLLLLSAAMITIYYLYVMNNKEITNLKNSISLQTNSLIDLSKDQRVHQEQLVTQQETLLSSIIQQEQSTTNLSSKIVQQEQLSIKLKSDVASSVGSLTSKLIQQEQTSAQLQASVVAASTAAASASAAAATSATSTSTAAAVKQEDDIEKRANLMAIAYYNAIRDKTPNKQLQWDLIQKHFYICGFQNPLYKGGDLLTDTFTMIFADLPYVGKTKCSDVVSFLTKYISTYKPKINNPDGLTAFEQEKLLNGGATFQSLATTFGKLDPNMPFYPADVPPSSMGIQRGGPYLFDITTESASAKKLLDDAKKTVM